MGDPVGAVLGTVLSRTILVSAVVVSMKLLSDGVFIAAAGLILSLAFFVSLSFADAPLLR